MMNRFPRAWSTSAFVLTLILSCLCALSASAGQSAESFYDYAGIDQILVSPDGRWLAASAHRGEDSSVLIQRVGNPKIIALSRSREIGRVAWESPDALVFEYLDATNIAAEQDDQRFSGDAADRLHDSEGACIGL